MRSGWLDAEILTYLHGLFHLIPGHDATRRSPLSCCPLGSHRSPAAGWEAAALACVGFCVLEVPPGFDCWAQGGGEGSEVVVIVQ